MDDPKQRERERAARRPEPGGVMLVPKFSCWSWSARPRWGWPEHKETCQVSCEHVLPVYVCMLRKRKPTPVCHLNLLPLASRPPHLRRTEFPSGLDPRARPPVRSRSGSNSGKPYLAPIPARILLPPATPVASKSVRPRLLLNFAPSRSGSMRCDCERGRESSAVTQSVCRFRLEFCCF